MALKLVLRSGQRLEIDLSRLLEANRNTIMRVIRESGSPYVSEVGADVLVSNFFGETNTVFDVSRYRIVEEDCCGHDGDRYRICNDRYIIRHCDIQESQLQIQQQSGSIVLLLESPHEAEYIYRCFGSHGYFAGTFAHHKAPASGTTGDKIDLCLGTVLLHIQVETELIALGRHVVISNPIQFQTSLHAIHGRSVSDSPWDTLRNNVWRTLWGNEDEPIQQSFLTRLNRYHPKVIINACTSELKSRVTSCVEAWISKRELVVPLYEIDHPSNWENLRPKLINP